MGDKTAKTEQARLAELYQRYLGPVTPVIADLLREFLDRQEVQTVAADDGEPPADWLAVAITETALSNPAHPPRLLRTIVEDWLQRGSRHPAAETAAEGEIDEQRWADLQAIQDIAATIRFELGGDNEAVRWLQRHYWELKAEHSPDEMAKMAVAQGVAAG